MKKQIELDQLKIRFESFDSNEAVNTQLDIRQEDKLLFVDFAISSDKEIILPKAELELLLPFADIHSCWTPGIIGNPVSIRNKGICEWRYDLDSQICKLAPVGCFYSLTGENKFSVALSDTKESVRMHIGAYEEERAARILIRLFEDPSAPRTEYRGTLRLDRSSKPYYEAIEQMTSWYEELLGNAQMPVPEAALEPVYSTWYSFHQNLSQQEIEDQCRLSADVGCKTVILDDGWQTDDSNRGYKFCGDWLVSENRFPEMKEHVARVQAMGMNYMLWLSVPFMGQGCEVWDEFKDNLLFYSDANEAGVLDPRYPQVRDYLISTYCRVMEDYGLDGLKLDFIDQFDMRNAEGKALLPDAARDTESLAEAIDLLLSSVRSALETIKPDVLIEFRQKYIGPMIRKYGNMFRVHDCPNDSIMNRMSIMDLRMFSGDTAIHSDMFIWSNEDPVESASLHFINTLFSVPQISPDMKELSDQHIAMTRHWLSFWKEHRDLLLQGKLKSCYPEMQYPVIESQLGNKKIVTVHASMVADLFTSGEQELILVNGSLLDSLYVKLPETVSVSAVTFDCLGNTVSEKPITLNQGLNEIAMPKSGYMILSL